MLVLCTFLKNFYLNLHTTVKKLVRLDFYKYSEKVSIPCFIKTF